MYTHFFVCLLFKVAPLPLPQLYHSRVYSVRTVKQYVGLTRVSIKMYYINCRCYFCFLLFCQSFILYHAHHTMSSSL